MIRTNWLERWAQYSPQKIGIKDVQSGRSFTYEELYRVSNRLARVFQQEYNIQKGDRVAVLSQNCAEFEIIFFALQHLGAILVPVNYQLSSSEIDFIMGDSSPKLLIYQDCFEDIIAHISFDNLPSQRIHTHGKQPSVEEIISNTELTTEALPARSLFQAPCMILYTAGTTAKPKGALITNEMIFWNSVNTSMRLNLTRNDMTITFSPFFHTDGWHALNTPFLHRGAGQIITNGFHPAKTLELCDSEAITVLFATSAMMKTMADLPEFSSALLKSVRFALVGGDVMSVSLMEAWAQKGIPIRQIYGLTEVGPNCFSLPEQDAIRKVGSIGFPNFYIETKIEGENGEEVGINEVGELLLKGQSITPGYWNNSKATNDSIRDGWFHTGDIARKDEDGYFYIIDRKNDIFTSGDERIYPSEIEHFLLTHPKIAEVAVVGVPDEKSGEIGKAFVVPKQNVILSSDEILDFCKGKLSKTKTPKFVELIDELPKGITGKVLKRELKARR